MVLPLNVIIDFIPSDTSVTLVSDETPKAANSVPPLAFTVVVVYVAEVDVLDVVVVTPTVEVDVLDVVVVVHSVCVDVVELVVVV